MLPPPLRKIRLQYTTTELLFRLGALQRIAGRLARFYLETGGRRSPSWPARPRMGAMVEDPGGKGQQRGEALPTPPTRKAEGATGCSLDSVVWQDYDAGGGWVLKIGVELGNYYVIFASFLPALKKARPEVYEVVRMALSCFANCMSHNTCITPSLIYEYWVEPEITEIVETGGDDERNEAFDAALKEKEVFEAHIARLSEGEIRTLAPDLKTRIDNLPRDALSDAERSWLLDMAEFIWSALRSPAFADPDDTSDREAMDISMGFAVLWEVGGPVEEYWNEVLEADSQSLGYPYRQFTINNRKDLIRALRAVKQLVTAQRLLDQGRLWEKNDYDETTEQSETEGMLCAANL